MSEGTDTAVANGAPKDPEQRVEAATNRLSAQDLANRSRFQFKTVDVELPELGGSITLKALSVEEREMLPDPTLLREVDDKGERTAKALKAAGETFSLICMDPKVTPEQAEAFLGGWPITAYDRVNEAYDRLVGGGGEEKAAYAEFPEGDDGD